MNQLTPVQQKFILHWGEMGLRWGINRTVAQIHALLYISPRPLNADDIVETLGVARSNVSTSLRELQSWGIVKLVHVLNDKRDHFQSMTDVWEMFRVVLDERKRREIDPTLALLRECVAETEKTPAADDYTRQRLLELQNFFETTTA
ncbi:MAG TPA: MarR family transcriptional regulator, partial [Dongiaceae bacterium]|nr:MarR family transcriptional regulator [Dongiaceae bacterium]